MDADDRVVVKGEAIIEDFEDGSLIFLCNRLQLIEINPTARRILSHMERGNTTPRRIARELLGNETGPNSDILTDVLGFLEELEAQGAVRNLTSFEKLGLHLMDETRYLRNPDVSCRIEDEDGAILYNADTDGVHVINPTGLAIWEALAQPLSKADVAEHLMSVCDGAPPDRVVQDVDEFMEQLQAHGFIGKAETI